MSQVVKTLVANLELPDGNLYPTINTLVTLTDAQYAQLSTAARASDLQDMGQALSQLSVLASPFTFTATVPEILVINPNGATVSALKFNGVTIPVTTSIVPMSYNDTVMITYTGGPPLMYTRG